MPGRPHVTFTSSKTHLTQQSEPELVVPAAAATSGKLEVKIEAVEFASAQEADRLLCERGPVGGAGEHPAHLLRAGRPAADGKQHLQRRVLLLQGDHAVEPEYCHTRMFIVSNFCVNRFYIRPLDLAARY